MRRLIAILLLAPLLGATVAVPPHAAAVPGAASTAAAAAITVTEASAMPTRKRWRADVHRVMRRAPYQLHHRLARRAPGERLALNLDIDNTSLMTYYDKGEPVRRVLQFVRHADRHGVRILFNSARPESLREHTVAVLQAAGFPVDGLCLRQDGESTTDGKQRCRDEFGSAGYTLIFNLGNRPTDFVGDGYERVMKLPDYGLRLR